MVNKTQVQICASAFFLVVSVAFVIIGALLPGQIVQPLINSGVKKAVPINQDNFSPAYDMTVGSDWNKFVNTSLNSNWHVYNLTNLYDVLVHNAIPIYQDIQINVIEWQLKFNVTYSPDQTLMYYYLANFYVVQDQASQDLLSQTIISPNPLFPAAAQQAQYSLNFLSSYAATGSTTPPSSSAQFSDTDVMAVYINTVLSNIQGLISDPSSKLQQGFHVLSVPAYFQTILTLAATLNLAGSTNPVVHWGKLDGNQNWTASALALPFPYNTMASDFSGFELPTAVSNPSLLALLWNATQPGSLAANMDIWSQGLTTDAAQQAAVFSVLRAYLGPSILNVQDFGTILQWLGSLLSVHFASFEATVVLGVQTKLKKGVISYVDPNSADIASLTTFVDLGYYQFATGAITSLLAGVADFPTGTVDTALGAAAGLGNAGNVNNAEPLEIATACYVVNKPAYSHAKPVFLVSDVKDIFSGLSGKTTVAKYPQLAGNELSISLTLLTLLQTLILPSWIEEQAALQSLPTPWDYFITQAIEPALKNNPQTAALAQPLADTLLNFTFMNNATTSQCFFDWLVTYLGNEMTGVRPGQKFAGNSPYVIGADGVAPQNSGMFFRITIREVLTGVTADKTRLGQSIPGSMCDPFELIEYPTNPFDPAVQQYVLNKAYTRDLGRQYTLYTGIDDYRKTGLLYQYYGTRSFQGKCQISDPEHTGDCGGYTSGVSNTFVQNFTVWNTVTNLDQVSDAHEFPALQGDQEVLEMWVSNVARVVPFRLQGSLQVKDISTNQYYADQSVLQLSASSPNYWKSAVWNDEFSPDGTIDLTSFENAPVTVSWPHFYGADPRLHTIMKGLEPSYALHHSEVDVDPLTGLTLQAFKRLQANFKYTQANFVWNNHYDAFFTNLTTFVVTGDTVAYSYVPYYWGDQNNVISDSDNDKYYKSIILPKKVANILQIVLPIVGGIGMIVFSITLYRSCAPRETARTRYGDV